MLAACRACLQWVLQAVLLCRLSASRLVRGRHRGLGGEPRELLYRGQKEGLHVAAKGDANEGPCCEESTHSPLLEALWAEAGLQSAGLIIRSLSGAVVLEHEAATARLPVATLVKSICEQTGAHRDTVQLCAGGVALRHTSQLGDSVAPAPGGCGGPLELTLLRLSGPAVVAEASSGRHIKVLEHVPVVGAECHLDRNYRFLSLGDFAKKPNMRYIITSNDDKNTPPAKVMWTVEVRVPVTVYLNFRSESHVAHTGAHYWLERDGWSRVNMESTVSSGIPSGPYSGPVYEKASNPGTIHLMGSNCAEGTYFVFVEVRM